MGGPAVPDQHRKKSRLARKAELARASRKRKKAYLNELEDEVQRLMVELAEAEAAEFSRAMDAADRETAGADAASATSPSAASPSELSMERLRIAEVQPPAPCACAALLLC